MFVPSNAYDNFKAAVLDKYAADETIQSNYSNKIVFIEKTRQLWVKGVFYDAGLSEIQKTLQDDINTRIKQVASDDQQYLGVATSNNVATLNVKKDAIHNYVVDNVWLDYTPPIISGKSSNSNAFYIILNATEYDGINAVGGTNINITPDSNGVWNYDLSGVNITSALGMFLRCPITSLDISNLDTSKVTDMSFMFNQCKSLTSLDASNFDTSNVTNTHRMFSYCSNLISLDLSNFNMNNVTETFNMFAMCNSLESIYVTNCDEATVGKIKAAVTDAGLSESIVKTNK